MPTLRALSLLALVSLAACAKDNGRTPSAGTNATATKGTATNATGGTVVISVSGEPDNLLPPITTATSGQQVEDLIFQRLADIGPELNSEGDAGFTANLATRWEWSKDSLSIAFHLDPAARWHDDVPVRAIDVAFSHALYVDPKSAAAAASQLANVDSVTVRDSLTAVVWFRKRTPSQFFDIVMQMLILPEHLLRTANRSALASNPLARQPVGSGPFRVVRWLPTQLVELAADTTGGRRRAQLDRVIFTMADDPVTAFTRVATGEADVWEAVRPEQVAEVRKNAQLHLVSGPALEYSYLGFNLLDPATGKPHPIFSDRNVRRALSLATDRKSIVANIYDTLAVQARGPFTSSQANADPSLLPLPYAPDSANALLDAAGWRRGPDSLRHRNGATLAFSITVPTSSVARMRGAVLLQEQFRRVGAAMKIESSDMRGFLGRATSRKFDTMAGSFGQDAGLSNVRDAWTSAGAAKGGNNFGAYRNPAFDAQVDSALADFDPAAMRAHFARAWRIIADDAPAIWIAEPRRVMAVQSRIVTTGMRPDSWWAGLAHWSIPADKRIARDAPAAAGAAH